ncbi:MAG: hypothetical protein KF730_14695 [Sphingomonas sp.]|uniref:hypothetical protein n=1 Tax=Sphingomonas sp. TaxID=28214 RepID=UPI002600EBE2|nr:hypothetical protein [Sphingomonas sp.]MBX3565815.1 hypothetical protein [Sphingomonas sp.]
MRIISLALLLLPAAALAADRDPPAPAKVCQTQPQIAIQPAAPNRPQKLNEMPKAEAFYAVLRIEDGCEKLVRVREYKRERR